MVRAGFSVRMKMPPPLFPPSGMNTRFSPNTSNFPGPRKPPRDYFAEPPSASPFVRRPPPPLMSQQPLLPPLKRRFFPPRDAPNDFSVSPMRPRMAPGMGFGMKRNNTRGSLLGSKLTRGDNLNVGGKAGKFPRFPQTQKVIAKNVKNETKSTTKSKKKSKKKTKKKTYTLTKEKSMKKPWVNEALKVEIEKKFTLLEEAKAKNEPEAWNAYLEQKKLVDEINQALRLEYLGNHPELDVQKPSADNAKPAESESAEAETSKVTDNGSVAEPAPDTSEETPSNAGDNVDNTNDVDCHVEAAADSNAT